VEASDRNNWQAARTIFSGMSRVIRGMVAPTMEERREEKE